MNIKKAVLPLLLLIGSVVYSFAQQTSVYTINLQYRNALELFDKEKFGVAQLEFEKVDKSAQAIQFTPADRDNINLLRINSTFYQALCAMELFNDQAEFLMLDFVEKYPENALAKSAFFRLGKFYYRQNNFRDAVEWFEKADMYALSDAERLEYKFKIGYSYFMQKDYKKAKGFFRDVRGSSTKYGYPASYYYAYTAYVEKDYPTALETFSSLKDSKIYGNLVPYYIAQIYYQTAKYDELIAYSLPVLKTTNPKNESAMYRLVGSAYFKKSDYRKAREFYNGFLKNDSIKLLNAQDLYQIGYANYQAADYGNAIKSLERLADSTGIFAQNGLYVLGNAFLKQNNKQSARNAFQKVAKQSADEKLTREGVLNYGKLSYELNFNEVAVATFRDYIKKYPNDENTNEAKAYLGEALAGSKNYQEALDLLETVNPKSKSALQAYQQANYFRGVELFNLKDFKAAISLFDKAIKNGNDKLITSLATYWKAESNLENGLTQTAISGYQQFLATASASETNVFKKANYNLGYAYFSQENYGSAANWFDKYLANPETDKRLTNDAILRSGDCAFALKNYEKAVNQYNKIINLNASGTDYALYQRAIINGLQNQSSTKITALQNLLNKYPSSNYADDAKFEIAATYLFTNESSSARTAFNQFVSSYPKSNLVPRAYLNLGLISYNLNEDDKALSEYKKVVSNYSGSPESKEAMQAIRNIYIGKGDADGFLNYSAGTPNSSISAPQKDSISFQAANSKYLKSNFSGSINSFSTYLKNYPSGYFATDAHYYRGESYLQLKDYSNALNDFKVVLSSGNTFYNEKSLVYTARILVQQQNCPAAKSYLNQLQNNSQLKETYGFAINNLMSCYEGERNFDSTLLFAKKVIEYDKTSTDERNLAGLFAGKSLLGKKDTIAAINYFKTVATATTTIVGAESRYFIALDLFNKNKLDDAKKMSFVIINDIPSYDYWIGKSFLLLGDIYTKQGDNFQAKSTLQSVLDNYEGDDEIKPEARKKLDELNKLDN